MPDEARQYSFGDFILLPNKHVLYRNEEVIHLRPKVFETLLYLVERKGSLVKKDELLDAIWPGIIVTENTLSQCIDAARKALGDNAREPQFIQTVPRLGFKFIGEVSKVSENKIPVKSTLKENGEPVHPFDLLDKKVKIVVSLFAILCLIITALWFFAENDKPSFNSIAVLPFTNLNGDIEQDYFADGMTEALIAGLGKIDVLRVISRTSVMLYKEAPKPLTEIARELNVGAIIEGTVLRSGERVRITAKLINAYKDQLLWVKSYERDIQDILVLQRELAQAIAKEIRIELAPKDEKQSSVVTVNPDAYEAYLKGRYFWNKRTEDGFKKGFEFFNQAIELDENFALAYAGLADSYTWFAMYHIFPETEAFPRAKTAATKALALDDLSPESHISMGVIFKNYYWDWQVAEDEFKRAITLNPNYAQAHKEYSEFLMFMGRFNEALSQAKQALELDPFGVAMNGNMGMVLYRARQYDASIAQIRKTIDMVPDMFPGTQIWHLSLNYIHKGLVERAISELLKWRSRVQNNPDLMSILGYAYGVAGKKQEAVQILDKLQTYLKEPVSYHNICLPLCIAVVYIGLEESDNALNWIEKAYSERCWLMIMLKTEPVFDVLRESPRFMELIKRMNF